jgi:hypothetical protein
MSTTDRTFGTEEVSRQLGMSPEWVRRQVQAGRLGARVFTIGGRPTYRFTQAAIDHFLARYSVEARGDGTPIDLDLGE